MFSHGSVVELLNVNYVMTFSIFYWANYTQGKTKLSRKSENAMADDRGLKFLYDADLRHVESLVRCHRKYKNGRIKVDRVNNLYLLTRPIVFNLEPKVRPSMPLN